MSPNGAMIVAALDYDQTIGPCRPCCKFLYPRCEYHHCGRPANWTVWNPWGKYGGRPVFMCTWCLDFWQLAMSKPMKGIDRPAHADEDWRPSLMDHIRFARIEMEHEERIEREKASIPIESEQERQRRVMREGFAALRCGASIPPQERDGAAR